MVSVGRVTPAAQVFFKCGSQVSIVFNPLHSVLKINEREYKNLSVSGTNGALHHLTSLKKLDVLNQ